MSKRVVITGATGLIGKKITKKLLERGDAVTVFTRSPEKAKKKLPNAHNYVEWDYMRIDEWYEILNDADAVIHLAGENVMGSRWNNRVKARIRNSRVKSTENIIEAIKKNDNKPKALITASSVGYYGMDYEGEVTEDTPAGKDFLAIITKEWEEEGRKAEELGVRHACVRIGIVLDKDDGALPQMMAPFKFFMGGPLGSGEQTFSWVHIDDITDLFIHALDSNFHGAINGAAPQIINMEDFCGELGKVMNKPSWLKVPKWAVKLAIGEAGEVVTEGVDVVPKRTSETGYQFKYVNAYAALKDILL